MDREERKEEPPMEQEASIEEPKYLFDFFEQARRVVIPGRDGDQIYMFKPKRGLYFVGGFYFIKVENTIHKVGVDIDPRTGQEMAIEEIGKLIIVVTQHNDKYIRAYLIRQSDFSDKILDDLLLYFDAATAQVFHRYTRELVKVFDENDELFEEEEVSGKGFELNRFPVDKVPRKTIEYPEYA